ncbi:DUF6879 family protein [Actinomadura macrotermitis]|uniref:DUF6879 domain-containing protein n=1 Tax=Actinomadura macrotermitis TaxID=2585200 RepID=A0A7K0C3Y1_9ACTN|nr:DUF6879 family protein [Actinomadura macrotermitis]MQY08149.1 hypothetical protein [Actinomadura macrotermitis]
MATTSAGSDTSRLEPTPARLRTYGRAESKPTFAELLADCTTSAVHLEMHDQHITDDPRFLAWKEGRPQPQTSDGRAFRDAVSAAVARGVQVRRARIVSEPASEYIKWEHSLTAEHNIAAGEWVRWLPRPLASSLLLPGNPFWVFDGRMVRFSIFDGDGRVVGHQFSDAPALAASCASAFEAVWALAVDHENYKA